ncbi:acyl-CoA dehydrogenase [Saccharopolyspora terrae]|uniref:Acyl-CoA dehydrogenase n=1 Tax=Saccharopolyspora terrae TaxID=2530384 RepID=A0A4R4V310_9PSEU|nr:acyl-CoA dehydrogenase family protein [Saccharopolyspora terrae]TDC99508.1 acyl-CoA dehydrogenase [Saccharopolyspora terrae]
MTGLVIDSDDNRLIRESVAKIAAKYGHEYYAERARRGEHIGELWAELGEAGLLGVHLPEEFGGGGAGLTELAIVIEELAAHGMPLLVAVISPAICGSILAAHGSAEMKAEWLPGVAAGTRKMAFALTEPDAGSNSHNVSTTARKDGDGWVISGGKYYISAADESEAVLLVTRDGDGDAASAGRKPLSLFVVPIDAPGVTLQRIDTELTSPDRQFTVFLDNVRVGPEALIGEAGSGLRQVAGLNPERVLAAALCNGVGRYAVAKARDYACQRQVWSTPIGAHQGIAHPLAESHIAVELARLATMRAAELFDSGQNAAEAANIAKFSAAEASLKALDQSIQTHGGNGLSREYGLADLWFVTRLMRTAPVSREMVLNFVAQHSLGLPNSY